MDYLQLILALLAGVLAIDKAWRVEKKFTRYGWIGIIAIASFLVGAYTIYQKSADASQIRELAVTEIRKEIVAISQSPEVGELFAKRGASQDPILVASLHKRIKIGKDDLNAAVNRHIGSLDVEERSKLIKLIATLSITDEFLRDGYSDFTGSAARIKMYQAKKDGLFDLFSSGSKAAK